MLCHYTECVSAHCLTVTRTSQFLKSHPGPFAELFILRRVCGFFVTMHFSPVIFNQENVKETNDCSLPLLPQLFPLPLKCKQQLNAEQNKHLLSLDQHVLDWKA